jgi:hypothetical protein
MIDNIDEELFGALDNDILLVLDDENGDVVLEPNPIELNIPSSKEFDELFNELFDEENDIFGLLLNIHELLFFPKLKKNTKYKTITTANIQINIGFVKPNRYDNYIYYASVYYASVYYASVYYASVYYMVVYYVFVLFHL